MGKGKKIAKKANKKVVKKAVKRNVKQTAKPSHPQAMSRLEYEQSMMDPRFRAAMQGFNNPANNINQVANQQLHEQETRNNELTRQLSYQHDLATAKQANMKLKNELSTAKIQHQQELSAKNLELEHQRHKLEKEAMVNKWKQDAEISELKNTLEQERQKHADEQTRWQQEKDKKKVEHDLKIQQIQSKHDAVINKISEQTTAIKNLAEIESTRHKQTEQMLNSQTDLITSKIKSKYGKETLRLKELADDLKRKDEVLKTHYDALKAFKDSHAKLLEQQIKSKFDPVIQQINMQSETLKNINNTQQLLYDEQSKLQNAKVDLTETQIKAIHAPLIKKLEQQKQQLESIMKINGDVNGLYQKIEDLKTNIKMLKQQATEEQIKEHGSEVREVSLKTAPLLISQRLAEQTNNANIAYEKLYADVVDKGVKALGEEFKVVDIGEDALNDKLKTKMEKTQQKIATVSNQLDLIHRQLKMQEGLENNKIALAEAEAKLKAMNDRSSEYGKYIDEAGKQKADMEAQKQELNIIHDQMQQFKQNNNELYENAAATFNEIMDADDTGFIRKIAEEISGDDYPDPRIFPKVVKKLQRIHDDTLNLAEEATNEMLIKPPIEDNSQKAKNQRKFIDDLHSLYKSANDAGHNPKNHRDELTKQVSQLRMEKDQMLKSKITAQDRAKQLAAMIEPIYNNLSQPVRNTFKDEVPPPPGEFYIDADPSEPNYNDGFGKPNTKNTINRFMAPNTRSHRAIITPVKFKELQEGAGIENMFLFLKETKLASKNNYGSDDISFNSTESSAVSSAVSSAQSSALSSPNKP